MADLQLNMRLSADGSGLTGTLRTASGELREFSVQAENAGKKGQDSFAATEKSVSSAGRAIGTFAAAAGTAFLLLVRGQINLADEVGNTAKRLGVSAESLSALGALARRNSSDLGAVTSGLESLGNMAVNAGVKGSAGGKQAAGAFAALGVSVHNASGQIKPNVELMGEVAAGLAKLPDGAYKSSLATQLMSTSGKELSGTLDELATVGLQGVIDKATETGEVITTQGAARAKAFKNDVQALTTQVTSFAAAVGQDVLPTLLALANNFIDTGNASKKAGDGTSTLRSFVEGLGLSVIIVTETLSVLFTMLYGGIDIMIGLGTATVKTVAGIANAVQAVQAFQAGQTQVASEFMARAKSDFSGGWDSIAGSATRAWNSITSASADGVAKAAAYHKEIVDGYKKVGDAATGAGGDAAAAAAEQAAAIARQEEALKRAGAATKVVRDAGADYVDSLKKQVAAYGLTGAALERYRALQKDLTPLQLAQAMATIAQKEALDVLAAGEDKAAAALASLAGMQQGITDEIVAMRGELSGASKAQIEFNKTQLAAGKAYAIAAAAMNPSALDTYVKAMAAAREKLNLSEALDESAASAARLDEIIAQFGNVTPFEALIEQISKVEKALDSMKDASGQALSTEQVDALKRAHGSLNQQLEDHNLMLVQEGVSSLQKFAKEGTVAYTALGIAQDILAYKSALLAIANQGGGDVYTAFARIAAMIAMMASIGIRVGGGGGGAPSAQSAEVRQASQGTGSVLGDAEAKSESIANAVEITANATSELVGLNRGMLTALLALQKALGAAGGLLARGAGNVEFDRQVGDAGNWNWLSGGDSSVIDQGIIIAGGALNDMLNDIVVGAYQTVTTSGGWFHSDSTSDELADVSDQFGRQFSLIMNSIADTVRESALTLGLLPADIEAAMAAYQVEAIRISLLDLSAEEQQAELSAVFGSIFDGLAGSVVPFVEQFQQVGEGLGETLVRVATGVQVTQEAMRQLGLVIAETDPERFAQISESLIAAVGGIEEFIGGMQSFVSNFSTESHQFQVASEALSSAFTQAGLTVPATRDAMWELMQTLDATTAEGQEQIATLLRLSDVAGQYYSLLDKQVSEATEFLESLGLASGGISEFATEILGITESGRRAREAANAIAIAQGRQGASAIQLARITQWTTDQIAAAARRLQQESQDILAELNGSIPGSLDAINAQIAELESVSGTAFDGIANDSENLFEQWRSGIQSVQDYLDSMLLGDLSALTPEQQLAEARRQLEAMQQAALGGDADALGQLPQLADAYLRLLREFEASGTDYNSGFDWVRQLLTETLGVTGPGQITGSGGGTVQVTASAELVALYAARDALLAEQEGEHRRILAEQLAQNLRDMATLLNTPILEMIQLQGTSLQQLTEHLGIDLTNLTASSVEALGHLAATLGLSLTTMTGELGLTLADLSVGLAELTERVGIDLTNLTVGSTQTLALLATSLGADLSELATSLSVDLGSLADSQGLLNQALAAEINSLPAEQSALLAPLLDAITAATTEADANSAISALEDAVNLLAPDIRTQLAPYLADVFPADALSDLDYLGEIQRIAADQLDVLGSIRDNLRASNAAAGVPSYAIGTGYVPRDGLAMIHQGEGIMPAPVNAWLRGNGYPSGGGSDPAVVAKLNEISERIDRMDRNNLTALRENKETVDKTGERSDQRVERAIAENAPRQRSNAYG